MSKPTIGFIGLGLMGSAMVECLQKNGYSVTVMANRSRPNVDAAVARGATEVSTAKEVAAASDIVMLCMGTSEQVESRIYGDEGVLAGLKDGAVVIDFGTSLPESTKKIGADTSAKGGAYLDAPLGRTPAHAVDGLLNIMCSGDEAAFKKVEAVLNDLGENVFHLGALGTGHTIKLINNFFAMTTATAMSEAFFVADKAGVERKALYDVMAAGPLRSGMMDFIKAYAIDGDPNQLAFAVKNANKDVGYFKQMASDLGIDPMIARGTSAALGEATDSDFGEEHVTKMVEFYTARAKG